MANGCEMFCEILIAVLLPPVGVCFRHGCCSIEFIICLLLTLLGYIPGIIYALYAIVFVDRDQYFDEARRPLYSSPVNYQVMNHRIVLTPSMIQASSQSMTEIEVM